MVGKLSFRNLPFVPEKGDVIYVEQSYHEKLNRFIRNNYVWLRNIFAHHHLRFCYLPLLAEEIAGYYAPYLTVEERQAKIGSAPSVLDYAVGDVDIKPSLVFALDIPKGDAPCDIEMQTVAIDTKWYVPTRRTFDNLSKKIESVIKNHRHHAPKEIQHPKKDSSYTRFSFADDKERTTHFRIEESNDADSKFDYQSLQLIEEIRERVEILRNKGITAIILHKIIDESERLSRLRITKDYRIYLVDYQNMEIKMPVLPKAVFLLFLQHPEGIRFKELTDYYSELLQIYLKMRPIGGRMRHEQSIRDVTDPCSNSINEKCARIREAFIQNFDDRLAKNYYITGKRGEPKRIILDKSMIIWE